MRSLLSAEWLRLRRYWLPRVLLILLIVVVGFQLNGKRSELKTLRLEAETGVSDYSGEKLRPEQIVGNLFQIQSLEDQLRYPAVIGTAVEVSTGAGWYFLILLTAIMGGEDFARRTLSPLLARGVGRGRYLLARMLAYWMAMGAALLLVMFLATIAGSWLATQAGGSQGLGTSVVLERAAESALKGLRTWVASLPYVAVTLFWAVLSRQPGPAMGVGIILRTIELSGRLIMPLFAMIANSEGAPRIYEIVIRTFTATVGYNAEIVMNWGRGLPVIEGAEILAELSIVTFMPTDPWRAAAILALYLVVFTTMSVWILRRRDVGYGS